MTNGTVREACRRRQPLDGTDAEALEHALTITERERDEASNELANALTASWTARVLHDEAQCCQPARDAILAWARSVVLARNAGPIAAHRNVVSEQEKR